MSPKYNKELMYKWKAWQVRLNKYPKKCMSSYICFAPATIHIKITKIDLNLEIPIQLSLVQL